MYGYGRMGIVKLKVSFYVTSVSFGERTFHKNDFDKARNVFQDGTLLESMEKHEKNIFYNIRDDDDMNSACLKGSLHCSTSMYEVNLKFSNIKIKSYPNRNSTALPQFCCQRTKTYAF